ncbi:MAG TPA: methionyl-tRNA formyltransferase [Magnetospirillaceae bacterium]|nr:methionyl-tRNA formyltransferase [Magnetospirillaceae bacterium]
MPASPKIVFFGSGPVATATLEGLLPHIDVEAIITKPRAAGHRGSVPVLELAESRGIPVFTPKNKQELTELFETTSFTSNVGLVVDYGIIISRAVIDSFSKGIINSHFSLLPHWRGADPITFSILGGQPHTAGVSLMLINEKLDEGELLAQEPFILPPEITTPELTDALVVRSNILLIDTLPKYLAGSVKPYAQPATAPSYSRKLIKEDGVLDSKKPADRLALEVRAFAGWPKSKLTLFGHTIIVKKARVASNKSDGALIIACGNHTFLEILELTAPSGKTMTGADFLRGYKK